MAKKKKAQKKNAPPSLKNITQDTVLEPATDVYDMAVMIAYMMKGVNSRIDVPGCLDDIYISLLTGVSIRDAMELGAACKITATKGFPPEAVN